VHRPSRRPAALSRGAGDPGAGRSWINHRRPDATRRAASSPPIRPPPLRALRGQPSGSPRRGPPLRASLGDTGVDASTARIGGQIRHVLRSTLADRAVPRACPQSRAADHGYDWRARSGWMRGQADPTSTIDEPTPRVGPRHHHRFAHAFLASCGPSFGYTSAYASMDRIGGQIGHVLRAILANDAPPPWACPQSRAAHHGYDWWARSGPERARADPSQPSMNRWRVPGRLIAGD
jgi:hypothetical protein